MCPVGPSVSNSSIWERPSHTLRVTEVPSNSTHLFDPVIGFNRRFKWIFQLPSSKSKSCCPSRSELACEEFAIGALCADPGIAQAAMIRMHNRKLHFQDPMIALLV